MFGALCRHMKIVLAFVVLIFFVSCTDSKESKFVAYKMNIVEGMVLVTYGKKPGKYFGTFALYQADESLSVTRNDSVKFRNDVINFESIRYVGDEERGTIIIHDSRSAFAVCKVTIEQWKSLMAFTVGWSNEARNKFQKDA